MTIPQPVRPLFLCLTLALGFGLAPPASAGVDPAVKQALRQWKQRTASHVKFHNQQMKATVKQFCQSLKSLEQDLASGSVAATDAMLVYFLLVQVAQVQIMTTTDTVKQTIQTDGVDLQNQVSVSDPLLPFLVGTCQTLDSACAKVLKQEAAAINRIVRKLKRTNKKLDKKADQPTTAHVEAPANSDHPAPNAGGAPAQPVKALKIDSSAGSSSRTSSSDGKLCVGGTADPSAGSVTVTIRGPGAFTDSTTATVNPTTCRWSACFGGGQLSPGTLAEGNYTLEASQGTVSARSSIGVP